MESSYHDIGQGEAFQLAWDASSLVPAFTCDRKYYYSNVKGYRPKRTNHHFLFGGFLHRGRELYYKAKVLGGKGHEEALKSTIKAVLLEAKEWQSDDKYKNKLNLIRTLVWYLDKYIDDPLEIVTLANGKPAIELSFRFETEVRHPFGGFYMICGHIDALVRHKGLPSAKVADIKTTKSDLGNFFKQFSPDIQMPLYFMGSQITYHTEIEGVTIDAAQVLIEGSRFARGDIPLSPDWINEWWPTIEAKLESMEDKHDEAIWPMNPTACHHYGGCIFRGVCSKSPSVRQMYLDADFVVQRWEPLTIRGE